MTVAEGHFNLLLMFDTPQSRGRASAIPVRTSPHQHQAMAVRPISSKTTDNMKQLCRRRAQGGFARNRFDDFLKTRALPCPMLVDVSLPAHATICQRAQSKHALAHRLYARSPASHNMPGRFFFGAMRKAHESAVCATEECARICFPGGKTHRRAWRR